MYVNLCVLMPCLNVSGMNVHVVCTRWLGCLMALRITSTIIIMQLPNKGHVGDNNILPASVSFIQVCREVVLF